MLKQAEAGSCWSRCSSAEEFLAEWPDWFFGDQNLKIWSFCNLNGFGLGFLVTPLVIWFFLVFIFKSGVSG